MRTERFSKQGSFLAFLGILGLGATFSGCMVKINRMDTAAVAGITLSAVDDDVVYPSTTDSPTITWTYTAATGATVSRFEVAIGSTPGGTDISTWSSAGTATSWSKSGLSLTVGSTYYASVRAVDSGGNTATLRGDGWKVVSAVSVAALFSAGPNWNNYVRRASTTTACDGTELDYFLCLHGGERRKVAYTAAANCTGYTITDELGAFDWACDATGGAGNVFFYSKGLKKTKGLARISHR